MHMPPLHGANPKHFGAPEIPEDIDMLSDGESTGLFDTEKTTPISGDVTSDTEENPLNLEESNSEDQYFGGEDEAEEVSEVDLEIYDEDQEFCELHDDDIVEGFGGEPSESASYSEVTSIYLIYLGQESNYHHTETMVVQNVNRGRVLIHDIKSNPDWIRIFNDIKSDLILYMITTSMFLSNDECQVQVYNYVSASQCHHNIQNFDANTAFVKTVSETHL